MVDLYCERTGPGLWAEPVNVLTNAAFLIAALASWWLTRRSSTLNANAAVLIVLMAIVGIGSTLFHTLATPLARVMDVVPILIFQLCFFWLFLRRVARVRPRYAALGVWGLLALSLIAREVPHGIEWSLQYVPALIILAGLGIYSWKTQVEERLTLIAATAIFAVAIFLRTLDQAICPQLPVGTHFLWHVMSGAVMYMMFRALAAYRAI